MLIESRQQAIINKTVYISCVVPVLTRKQTSVGFFAKLQEELANWPVDLKLS